MSIEHKIYVIGEYWDRPAQISLSGMELDPTFPLVDCSIEIETFAYRFCGKFSIQAEGLTKFISHLETIISTNEGAAHLQNYTEESRLAFFATGNAGGEIIVEGEISNLSVVMDDRIYRDIAVNSNRNSSGIYVRFGGIETDQSYIQASLEGFKALKRYLK